MQTETNNLEDIKLLFQNIGFVSVKNELDNVIYVKPGFELDEFEIKMTGKHIKVKVPVVNSDYEYSTMFESYTDMLKYIKERLSYYNSNQQK